MFLENPQPFPSQKTSPNKLKTLETSVKKRVGSVMVHKKRRRTEEIMKDWVLLQYNDPESKKKISGTEVLLSCLYGNKPSWKAFKRHGEILKKPPECCNTERH